MRIQLLDSTMAELSGPSKAKSRSWTLSQSVTKWRMERKSQLCQKTWDPARCMRKRSSSLLMAGSSRSVQTLTTWSTQFTSSRTKDSEHAPTSNGALTTTMQCERMMARLRFSETSPRTKPTKLISRTMVYSEASSLEWLVLIILRSTTGTLSAS